MFTSARPRQDPTHVPELVPELRDTLAAAQEERPNRQGMDSCGQPEWIAYERTVMVDVTTALVIRHGLPLKADEIHQAVTCAEDQANGHVDYTSKWAIGCAHYVAGIARGQRRDSVP